MASPSSRHQRSIDSVLEQGRHVADFLGSLRPAEFCRTIPGTTERVRDVAAQLLVTQSQLLDALERTTTERPHPLPGYLSGLRLSRHQLVELADELAEHEPGPALATQFTERMQEIDRRLARPGLPEVLSTPTPLRLADLLRLIAVEWVLRSDDLTRAVPGHRPIEWHRGVIADAVRTLADTMRTHHPGQEIEVRVPPFAAVQCGSGSGLRHTRGTPPNVVECDPIPFVRLCRGRQSLAEAVRQGQARVSGTRADLSEWLPLY